MPEEIFFKYANSHHFYTQIIIAFFVRPQSWKYILTNMLRLQRESFQYDGKFEYKLLKIVECKNKPFVEGQRGPPLENTNVYWSNKDLRQPV